MRLKRKILKICLVMAVTMLTTSATLGRRRVVVTQDEENWRVGDRVEFASEKSGAIGVEMAAAQTKYPVEEEYTFLPRPAVTSRCRCQCHFGCHVKEREQCKNCFAYSKTVGGGDNECPNPFSEVCCVAQVTPNGDETHRAYFLGAPITAITFVVRHGRRSRVVVVSGMSRGRHVLHRRADGTRIVINLLDVHTSPTHRYDFANKVLISEGEGGRFRVAQKSVVNSRNEWDPKKLGWFRRDSNNGSFVMPGEVAMSGMGVIKSADCRKGSFQVSFLGITGKRASALMKKPTLKAEKVKVWRHGLAVMAPLLGDRISVKVRISVESTRNETFQIVRPPERDLQRFKYENLSVIIYRGVPWLEGTVKFEGTGGDHMNDSGSIDIRAEVFHDTFRYIRVFFYFVIVVIVVVVLT